MRGPQVESLVSLSWCTRQGTRGEGDGDADYLPPVSRARHYLALNISETVQDRDIATPEY